MKNRIIVSIILLITGLTSCTSMHPLLSGVTAEEINDIVLIEPLSYISLIEKGNQAKLHDSLSGVSHELITEVLRMRSRPHVTAYSHIEDTLIYKEIEEDIQVMLMIAEHQQNVENIRSSQTLDSLILSSGKRYGMVAVTTGFTRGYGNYGREVAKGVAVGVLTLGMYTQAPIKNRSDIYIGIVDARESRLVFYNRSQQPEQDPLDHLVLLDQLHDIFGAYFNPSNP
jgi:hypothetical protein